MTAAEIIGLMLSSFGIGYALGALFLWFRKGIDHV